MQNIEKEILEDYELKANELDDIEQHFYFILDSTLTIGDDKGNPYIEAWNYKALIQNLPQAIDLLHYKIKEMQDNLNKLYDKKRDTKEHTESRQA